MSKNTAKNYILNLIYHLFTLIVSLVTTPYISRVLENDGIGKYTFAFSIMTYFQLFANLGFALYSQRLIAQNQNDKEKQSKLFWELFILKSIVTISVSLLYFAFISSNAIDLSYKTILFILSFNIFDCALDISFFFRGNEQFEKPVIRAFIIKTISIICIFVFVKTREDLWLYTLIRSLSVILSSLSLWFYMPKQLTKIRFKTLAPFQHIKAVFVLFIPTIATSIYTSLDKILMGYLIEGSTEYILETGEIIIKSIADIENGNYEFADKLVKVALTVITSLGIVMLPNNTKYIEEGNVEKVKKNIYSSTTFIWIISIPLMLGLIAISDNLIPWYLGDGYDKSAGLLKILSMLIPLIGLSNVFGIQFLLPLKEDKKYLISIIIGATSNLILTAILVPTLKSYGAAIATVVAELIITIAMLINIKNKMDIIKLITPPWKCILAGLTMFTICFILGNYILPKEPIFTLIIIIIGCITYIGIILLTKEKNTLNLIKSLFNKKNK